MHVRNLGYDTNMKTRRKGQKKRFMEDNIVLKCHMKALLYAVTLNTIRNVAGGIAGICIPLVPLLYTQ